MRRLLLLSLAVALLVVPAARASAEPCWKRAIEDWYDNGKLDRTWNCDCIREAIAHLPVDAPSYANFDALYLAQRKACRLAARHVAAPAAKPGKRHRNLPALITSTILAVLVVVLLLRRRRQLRARRRPR